MTQLAYHDCVKNRHCVKFLSLLFWF